MQRSIAKLIFSVCIFLTIAPYSGSLLRASSNNWCSCDGWIYTYYTHPQYGPWIFLNQFGHEVGGPLDNPGPFGYAVCADACTNNGILGAELVACDYDSDVTYPDQHYQVSGHYIFEDYDDTSGGSASGGYDTGSTTILYCP